MMVVGSQSTSPKPRPASDDSESRSVVVHHLGFWSLGPRFESWRDYHRTDISAWNSEKGRLALRGHETENLGVAKDGTADLLAPVSTERTPIEIDCESLQGIDRAQDTEDRR